jgi:hypothetical protein
MMATGTSRPVKNDAARAPMTTGQKIKLGLILLLLLMLLWLIFNFADIKAKAQLGASYGAHVACSCRYIEGRPLEACTKDFEPGMGMVSLADDPEHKRITASVPLLAEAVAERRGEFGCQQLNDAEMDKLE